MISQNGWTVIEDGKGTKWWRAGAARLQLRPGPAGFLLCHVATWFDQRLEPLGSDDDDFGWGFRKIAGTDVWSNHASATAIDLNVAQHPQGHFGTFSDNDANRIHHRLTVTYDGKIRWGGDFTTTVDEMHWEIQASMDEVRILVAKLRDTPIGRDVAQANP